ncbi:hypothetical protein ACMV_18670 [Acidiphilium multivorum AIU301]|uniref:Uncharacterized protein n=1 Tax=Acidiphilium multivorum (strain DSM 11245 / JCM 8867 / NBRC 100883 / AIU 301) TaxID=926570 RepID=F0IZK4_ACIMA|nr:hypothetical protein ACMV_18670 [Acidiphilium multivorum AIU301]
MCIVFDGEMMRQIIFASRNPHSHRLLAPTISRTKRVRNMAQMHAPARHVAKPHKGWFRPALRFHTVENILACDGRLLSCQPPMNLSSVGSGTQKTPAALRRDNMTFVLSSISMDMKIIFLPTWMSRLNAGSRSVQRAQSRIASVNVVEILV